MRRAPRPATAPASAAPAAVAGTSSIPARDARLPVDPLQDAQQYVYRETPRVAGLPHTAPKYDELTTPDRVPVPAACIQIGAVSSGKTPRCKCYTQQGTPMDVDYNMCISIAQNGYFRDFDPDGRRQDRQQVVPQSSQVHPVSTQSVGGSRVVAFDPPDLNYRIGGTSLK